MSNRLREGNPAKFTIVIQPNQSWLHIDWRGIWEYRDLLFLLVRREFVGKYKQTILGPAWHILHPLLTAAMFSLVFARMAAISTDGLPHALFYLCGLLPWNYLAQNVGLASQTFTANTHLFEKVYFPRLILPLSVVASNLMAFALQLVTFFGFFVWFKFFTPAGAVLEWSPRVLLLPLLILYTAALSLGVSLWLAALSARYRDFIHLLQFLIQLWMFATPVIYPLSKVAEHWPHLLPVAALNPMSFVTESFRLCLLGRGTVPPANAALATLVTLVLFVSGVLIFQKVQRTFVDIV